MKQIVELFRIIRFMFKDCYQGYQNIGIAFLAILAMISNLILNNQNEKVFLKTFAWIAYLYLIVHVIIFLIAAIRNKRIIRQVFTGFWVDGVIYIPTWYAATLLIYSNYLFVSHTYYHSRFQWQVAFTWFVINFYIYFVMRSTKK